jgi:hypothetical protein
MRKISSMLSAGVCLLILFFSFGCYSTSTSTNESQSHHFEREVNTVNGNTTVKETRVTTVNGETTKETRTCTMTGEVDQNQDDWICPKES